MNTKDMSREQISALADGELVDQQIDTALAVLRKPEEQVTWDLYHQIGDVLRSDEMGFSLSADFASRMSARLDAEPAIVAPQLKTGAAEQIVVRAVSNGSVQRSRMIRRFAMPGAAMAAAVAAVVFVVAPQQSAVVADATPAAAPVVMASSVSTVSGPVADAKNVQFSSLAQQGEVTRDPRIDDYLLAHQRFSPSLYSTAQYARSAAFAIDSDK